MSHSHGIIDAKLFWRPFRTSHWNFAKMWVHSLFVKQILIKQFHIKVACCFITQSSTADEVCPVMMRKNVKSIFQVMQKNIYSSGCLGHLWKKKHNWIMYFASYLLNQTRWCLPRCCGAQGLYWYLGSENGWELKFMIQNTDRCGIRFTDRIQKRVREAQNITIFFMCIKGSIHKQ